MAQIDIPVFLKEGTVQVGVGSIVDGFVEVSVNHGDSGEVYVFALESVIAASKEII